VVPGVFGPVGVAAIKRPIRRGAVNEFRRAVPFGVVLVVIRSVEGHTVEGIDGVIVGTERGAIETPAGCEDRRPIARPDPIQRVVVREGLRAIVGGVRRLLDGGGQLPVGVIRVAPRFFVGSLSGNPAVGDRPVIFAKNGLRRVGVQQAGEIGAGVGVRGPGDGGGGQ